MRRRLIMTSLVLLGVAGCQTAQAQIRREVPGITPADCDYRCQDRRRYDRYEQEAKRDQDARRAEWLEEHQVDPNDDSRRYDGPRYDYR
jgi:hypothetical protein